jgi:hypothetical protein
MNKVYLLWAENRLADSQTRNGVGRGFIGNLVAHVAERRVRPQPATKRSTANRPRRGPMWASANVAGREGPAGVRPLLRTDRQNVVDSGD